MKLLQSASLLLSSKAVLANFNQMNVDFSEAVQAFSQVNGERTITQSDMALVNEYGCWCYFQNDHHKGKGQPIDGIDTLCKRLHDGYTCAMIDGAAMGETCVPWEVTYQSATGAGLAINMDIATIRSECDTQNPVVGCANWACKIEGYFVQQLLFYFVNGGLIDSNQMHSNGFNPNVGCPTGDGVQSERDCCDEQPLRFPFKTYDDARACCINHTFDATMYTCCADGSLTLGSCP